jgi:ABC-2 type transport system ATP-binding protein
VEHALKIRGVGKAYKDFALDDVSFHLPRGYIMGLIGPNGAGKTTLIKLVLNQVRRRAGSISVLGLDNLADEVAVKARIGYVPDEPHYPGDIRLADLKAATAPFYSGWDEAAFARIAAEFELPLRKKFKKLSHGMKMKFALALALSHGAELVILDEPTSGLDPVFRRQLLDRLAGLLQDGRVSVLFSTHITADLERTADLVTFLRNGRVVFSNPKDEVVGRWVVVKGGRDLLNADSRDFFEGVREREHGFEGLTSRAHEARRLFGDKAAVDRASLDDIMVLMGRGESHAA